jgi:hypothetical protein
MYKEQFVKKSCIFINIFFCCEMEKSDLGQSHKKIMGNWFLITMIVFFCYLGQFCMCYRTFQVLLQVILENAFKFTV